MPSRTTRAPALAPRTPLRGVAAVVLTLLAAGCGNDSSSHGNKSQKRFVYVPPPKPMATKVPEDAFEWLALVEQIRKELAEIKSRVEEHQEVHRRNEFDAFFTLDLDTLPTEHLAYLWHFADKGYFTVERKIIVKLLEDRLQVGEVGTFDPSANLSQRIQALVMRYEHQIKEFQTAEELYAQTHQGDFTVPVSLNEEQLAALKDLVRQKLAAAQAEVAQLDARINELHRALAENAQKAAPH